MCMRLCFSSKFQAVNTSSCLPVSYMCFKAADWFIQSHGVLKDQTSTATCRMMAVDIEHGQWMAKKQALPPLYLSLSPPHIPKLFTEHIVSKPCHGQQQHSLILVYTMPVGLLTYNVSKLHRARVVYYYFCINLYPTIVPKREKRESGESCSMCPAVGYDRVQDFVYCLSALLPLHCTCILVKLRNFEFHTKIGKIPRRLRWRPRGSSTPLVSNLWWWWAAT